MTNGTETRTPTSSNGNVWGAAVFGGILLAFLIYAALFIGCLEGGRLLIVGILCAVFAGLTSVFMSGYLGIRWVPDMKTPGKVMVQGFGGLAAFALVLWWWTAHPPVSPCQPYRVQVNVVNAQNEPVPDFKIWTSLDNTKRDASGSWSFEVPEVKKPPAGEVTVYADKKSAYLKGEVVVRLAENYNLTVPLVLLKDTSARVRGRVLDERGGAAGGALVHVPGHESEGVTTGPDGRFDLPAHAAPDERVQLYAVKGRADTREWFAAGGVEVTLTLKPRR